MQRVTSGSGPMLMRCCFRNAMAGDLFSASTLASVWSHSFLPPYGLFVISILLITAAAYWPLPECCPPLPPQGFSYPPRCVCLRPTPSIRFLHTPSLALITVLFVPFYSKIGFSACSGFPVSTRLEPTRPARSLPLLRPSLFLNFRCWIFHR